MDDNILSNVFRRVERCMSSLSSSSGHLAGYYLDAESFFIKEAEKLPGNKTKYHFTVLGYYESEFTVYGDDDNAEQVPEALTGSIVLDDDFKLVKDKDGRIMLDPWNCVDIGLPDNDNDSDIYDLLDEIDRMRE